MAQQWEYALFHWGGNALAEFRWVRFSEGKPWEPIRADEYYSTLRRLGEEGWELVSSVVLGVKQNEFYSGHYYYFKRPKV